MIVPARADDIPELCGLLAALFEQEADFSPDADKQSRALRQIIANPELGLILALRRDGRILGMVSLLFSVSTACGGKVAWLEDMVVAPSARGAGVGGMLIRAAIESAQNAGCLRITLLTDHDNHRAIRFYQRHGFCPSQMRALRLPLDQPNSEALPV